MDDLDERARRHDTIRAVLRSAGCPELYGNRGGFTVLALDDSDAFSVVCAGQDRLAAGDLDRYRQALRAAGCEVTDDPDDEQGLLVRWHGRTTTPATVTGGPAHPGQELVSSLAGWWPRFGARVADTVIASVGLVASLLCCSSALRAGPDRPPTVVAVVAFVAVALWWVVGWEAVQLARWSRTLGMRFAGIRVAPATRPDQPLSTAHAIARAACYPLLASVLGYLSCGLASLLSALWMLWDQPLRQCLHDKLAGTVVVYCRDQDR